MDSERYVITIDGDHKTVRLQDGETGETHVFTGRKALYDALGVLADWRKRALARGTEPVPGNLFGEDAGPGYHHKDGCQWPVTSCVGHAAGGDCVWCKKPGGDIKEDPYAAEINNTPGVMIRIHPDCYSQLAAEI